MHAVVEAGRWWVTRPTVHFPALQRLVPDAPAFPATVGPVLPGGWGRVGFRVEAQFLVHLLGLWL